HLQLQRLKWLFSTERALFRFVQPRSTANFPVCGGSREMRLASHPQTRKFAVLHLYSPGAMRTLGTGTAFQGERMTDASLRAAQAASTLDIREQFPALERQHNGHAVAYFDGPGGTQVPRSVVAAVTDYLYHHNANTHW